MGRPGRPRGSGRRDKSLKTVDRKPIRPLERQRMRPWLMRLLEEGGSNQICWMNKRDKLFRMAWKHAAGQNWDRGQDCNLFELWARHTGKYYDGDKPDHKRWKANFRCALNSLLDVEELKERGVRRGNNAFKVYRFLEEKRLKPLKTEMKVEPLDEEELIARSSGTRSRPRQPKYELDSEGSEMETTELDYPDYYLSKDFCKEETEEHSPLPHFDQICPFSSDLQNSFNPATRFPEASSPQIHSSSSDEDNQSTTSSVPTDDEVISMLLEPEAEARDFWQVYPYVVDMTVQEGPEEVISEDGVSLLTTLSPLEGPSVVVLESDASPDFTYTSLTL